MARSLDQILAEVTARSDPQRQIVLNQVSQLPAQQAADEASLAAKKDQAFEDITAGARRRGLGFSGIPLGEQAKYTATDYAPALANLKTSYGGRKATLESALADIGRSDYTTAYDIFDRERTFDENQRRYNLEQGAASRAAASAGASQGNPFAGLFGNIGNSNQPKATGPDQLTQRAYDAVQDLIGTKNASLIQKTYSAIKQSAGYGNAYDKIKLQLIEQLYPAARNFGKNTVPLGRGRLQ